jgi:small subunit ribosomal protein S20
MKKVLGALDKKDAKVAKEQLSAAYKLIDRAVSKGVLHRNSGARKKARLAARVNALGAAPAAK